MVATLNPKQLLICKNFFSEAQRLAVLGDDFSKMKAVLFLDFSVEILLNALVNDFANDSQVENENLNPRQDMVWSTLWRNATQAVKNKIRRIPNHRQLKLLREIRNLVQHAGMVPDSSDVSDSLNAVHDTLSKCFSVCYGLDFIEFKLWDVITNQQLRRLLKESQEALNSGKAVICLAGCKIAFDKLNGAIRANSPGSESIAEIERTSYKNNIPSNYMYDPTLADFLEKLSEKIGSELRRLHDDTQVANLGLSMADTAKFRRAYKGLAINKALSGSIEILLFGEVSDEEREQDARQALDYLSSYSLLAQQAYPSVVENIRIEMPLSEQPVWKESNLCSANS